MFKKLILSVLVLATGICAFAQKSNNELYRPRPTNKKVVKAVTEVSSFPQSDIKFWTGSGVNKMVVVMQWDEYEDVSERIALAWGVKFNGTVKALDILDTISTYDSRFTYSISGSLLTNMEYHDDSLDLEPYLYYLCYKVNGEWANAYADQDIVDGDFMEMCDGYSWNLTTAIPVTDPNPKPQQGHIKDTVIVSMTDSALTMVYDYVDSAQYFVLSGMTTTGDYALNLVINESDTIVGSYSTDDVDANATVLYHIMADTILIPFDSLLSCNVTADSHRIYATMEYLGKDSILYDISFIYTRPVKPVDPPTAVESLSADNVSVISSNGEIIIYGAEGKQVSLSDLNGRMFYNKKTTETVIKINDLTPGIYIIRINGKSYKVIF